MLEYITEVDMSILFFIYENLRSELMNIIMVIITTLGDGGILWIAIAVLCLCFKKTRKCGIAMGVAMVVGLAIGNGIIKNVVGRIRPFQYWYETSGEMIDILIKQPGEFSFPSGHTQNSFAAATVLMMYDKRKGIPALIMAALIAFSRLYVFVHYPTDILGGMFFGILWAVLSVLFVNFISKKLEEKKMLKAE